MHVDADRRAFAAGRAAVVRPPCSVVSGRRPQAALVAAMAFSVGASVVSSSAAQQPADSAPRIAAVVLDRAPVFDAAQGTVGRLGNAFHVTTRERVVRRELLLRPGMPYDSLRLAETARNLRALGLFRRVFVDTIGTEAGTAVRVRTQDGWSLRPLFSLTTSAGQSAVSVGLEERNFLGLGAGLAVQYRDNPDRSAVFVSWRHPRLVADVISASVAVDERSDGRSASAAIGQPWFANASRWQGEATLVAFDGTVLRFRDGDPRPAQRLTRRYELARLTTGHALAASPRGYVRVGLAAQLRRDDFVPEAGTLPIPRTVTGLAGVTFAAERADFAIVRNVASILREEDVAVGPSVRLAAYASPRAFGYADDGVGLAGSARLGTRVGRGYASVSASVSARFAGGLDSGSVRVATTNALVPAARHALILHGQAGWQRSPVPGEEYDVGLGFGPRGFPLHAFTGDRLVLLAAEYRWTVAEEALGVLGLGVAAFGEWGGAWYAGSPRRTGGNAGVGVRWAFVRGAENGTRRVDLVRRFASDRLPAGWSLVVGEGFVF